MKSVLQDWVMELPIRAQGTLLTGIRGCDLAPKPIGWDTPERQLVAFLRFCVMNPADAREVDVPGAFFRSDPPIRRGWKPSSSHDAATSGWKPSEFGHYPQHWYSHVMHCFEVVGYCHPVVATRSEAHEIYLRFVNNLHLRPESAAEMMGRLTEDRIASGAVVS